MPSIAKRTGQRFCRLCNPAEKWNCERFDKMEQVKSLVGFVMDGKEELEEL